MPHNHATHKTFELYSDDRIGNLYCINVEIFFNIDSNAPEPGHSITDIEVIVDKDYENSLITDIIADIENEICMNPDVYIGSAQQVLSDEESEEGEYKGDMEREGEC